MFELCCCFYIKELIVDLFQFIADAVKSGYVNLTKSKGPRFTMFTLFREARKKPAGQENLGRAKTTSSSAHSFIFTSVGRISIMVNSTNNTKDCRI
jgi:hypothetical protein